MMKQPKIRYFLEVSRDGHRDKPELVLAEISYGYSVIKNGKKRSKPFKISMESSVLPKHFGKELNRFKFDENVFSKHSRNYGFFTTHKIQLEGAVNKLAIHYQSKNILPTPKEFQHALKVEMGQLQTVEQECDLIVDHLENKIRHYHENSTSNKKDSKRTGTIKSYRSLLLHLQEYQLATNTTLTFENFTEEIYWQLWEILDNIYRGNIQINNPSRTKKRRTDSKGYAAKSVQKYQKNLLAFLRVMKDDVDLVLDLDNENLVLGDTKSGKSIYMTNEELKLIYESNVSFDEDLQAAKEFALISGLTGLRYEGVVEAAKAPVEVYEKDNYKFHYIHIDLGKVNKEVCIPLLKPIMEIAQNHSGRLPSPPSNQDINLHLKGLYRHLNIKHHVDVINTNYKGEVEKFLELKCDVISCHDARRGFITNLEQLGVRRSVVMDITHPSKVENAMHALYNKSSLLDKARNFVDEVNRLNSVVYHM